MSYSQNIMDDEYEKFIRRMNPPRVVIDNESCKNATVIQVDSANKHGILLEVVQILTDLNFIITKAYICSDGGWFMDVFNVTNQDGNKITEEPILDYIMKSLGPDSCFASSMRRSVGVTTGMDHTSIELIGSDRPGLLSEVSAVLTNLRCNVVNAEVWTHNTRAAAIMQVTDDETGGAIADAEKLSMIKKLLCNVLRGSNKSRDAKTLLSHGVTHTDRRLHQLMFADRDYERAAGDGSDDKERPNVNVVNWQDKDYSVVTIRCKDRPKLLFDTICTLTDMQYVVFHGNVDTEGPEAYQEYCIRHIDGSPVKSDAERQRVIQCLEAAIERRVSEGLKLELCTTDRVGLLSNVTRIFRENSLTVTRAEVSTRAGKALNTFYVRDSSGYPVDTKIIESVRQTIGQTILRVKGSPEELNPVQQESPTRFLFGGLFKSRSFCNFGSRQMSGVSLGKSHGRPRTGKKTSRRCNDGTGADHVVLIDVECETFGNVIFIDVPESTPKKFRGKTAAKKDKRRSPLRNIIFIDDDESNGNEYPKFGLEDDRHFFHDPSPSMRPCSSSKSATEPLDEIGDDCQFVRENISPVKLSKCKRTYSGKAPVQNRYGLMSDSESSSSDDDEVMGDYSGLLREEWQKASLKRKNDNSGQSGVRDINSASAVGIQPEPGESKEHLACPGYSKSSTEKENLSPRPTCESHCNETGSFNGKEDLLPGGFRWWTTGSSVKDKSDCNYSNGSVSLRESSICRRASSGIQIGGKKCVDQENGKWIPDRTSELSSNHNETQPRNSGSLSEEDLSESVSMSQHKDERHDDMNGKDGENVERCVENCITTERERFKETSEYKKALEEELASRQRALAIQAQEAKKMKLLLKRKKAESMRLLEMEKRQKQRVEEMRETQKKDVENMNLKEQIRAEVRKELSKLEMTCHDMASVLHGLGITVGNGTSHEVRVAYKKALLKFHPDRASQSDLQQQVEAEEKFKLISRMKDKYLPSL
ncbi:hypothetical protein KY290_026451 [Solanum tuberosum]|uniref:Amino acid binding protein n=1 Tax=Solanum tuberosum TaxID=4113 RepID=A0ABQ7UWJ7_SOLTU|nr:hypothetical protein KY290_026451 [Solanum tuberosum]